MLKEYRKEQRKIAMGLLSFHQNLTEYQSLLKEIDMYETSPQLHLYFWNPEQTSNIQGIVGVEINQELATVVIHDISLTPSYRGEQIGYLLLDELLALYPDYIVMGTVATSNYLAKWKTYKS